MKHITVATFVCLVCLAWAGDSFGFVQTTSRTVPVVIGSSDLRQPTGRQSAPAGDRWQPAPTVFSAASSPVARSFQEPATAAGSAAEENAEAPEVEEEAEEEPEEIETDRDSFTPATTIVKPGRLLMEAAYSFIDNRDVKETHSYPELLFRYGLNEVVELRLGWNYEIGGAGNPVSGNTPSGLDLVEGELEEESRIVYGTKLYLTGQTGWTPTSSLILQGFTPTYGESNHTDVSATYVFGWTLPNRSALDFAARYGTGRLEEDEFNTWEPSAVWKFPVGDRWKAHVEYFGVFTEGREEETTLHFFSPGAHYLITNDFEVGMRVGWGLNEQTPNFFVNAGIGWQF